MTQKTTTYDFLLVANGHYTIPYLPSIHGIKAFANKYPDVISHARDFRSLEPFRNKKTVVIGGSASGLDIGEQIEEVCRKPLIRVVRSGNKGDDPVCYQSIEEFVLEEQAVRFRDVHGELHLEKGVEKVLFATGYLYDFPFFGKELGDKLVGGEIRGQRVKGLYKQLFWRQYPSCAFMVLPLKVVPFPLAEAQASVVARVWSGRLALPNAEVMAQEESDLVSGKGDKKAYHVLNWPEDVAYLNEMVEWAGRADRREGLENQGRGLMAEKWGDDVRWLRAKFPEIRKRFKGLGEKRGRVARWEELGIDYDDWRREQEVDLAGEKQSQVSG